MNSLNENVAISRIVRHHAVDQCKAESQMKVLETELAAVAASASSEMVARFREAEPEDRRLMAARLAAAFQSLADGGAAETSEIEIAEGGRYDSVLFGKREGGRILAYSFSGLASDLAVPLFSAAVALSTGTLGAGSAGDGANAILGLWRNLAVLRLPDDADAIAVVRAIIAVRAREGTFTAEHHPSTREIADEATFDPSRVMTAIRTLRERRIVDIEQWTGQHGDEADEGNTWKLRL